MTCSGWFKPNMENLIADSDSAQKNEQLTNFWKNFIWISSFCVTGAGSFGKVWQKEFTVVGVEAVSVEVELEQYKYKLVNSGDDEISTLSIIEHEFQSAFRSTTRACDDFGMLPIKFYHPYTSRFSHTNLHAF